LGVCEKLKLKVDVLSCITELMIIKTELYSGFQFITCAEVLSLGFKRVRSREFTFTPYLFENVTKMVSKRTVMH
jgi:hypothetical protein